MIELKDLLEENETIVTFHLCNEYWSRNAITVKGSDDISGALEMTLHRILEGKWIYGNGVTNMNYTYFGNRIERSPLGNMGLQLLEAQEKLVSQEYEVENLRIKAAMYKAYFFRNFILAEKLEKQSEENRDALIGEFDGFSYASWRANAIYRTLEDMCDEGLLTEKEYRECKV